MSSSQSRLSKAGAERLLGAIDTDGLLDAFVDAARAVLRLDATHANEAVLERAGETAGWSPELLAAVVARDDQALNTVVVDLCELRSFGVEPRSVREHR